VDRHDGFRHMDVVKWISFVDRLLSIVVRCILIQFFLWACRARCGMFEIPTVLLCLAVACCSVSLPRWASFGVLIACLATSPMYLLDWGVYWIEWPYPTVGAIFASLFLALVCGGLKSLLGIRVASTFVAQR
jgi:hypothetical protein